MTELLSGYYGCHNVHKLSGTYADPPSRSKPNYATDIQGAQSDLVYFREKMLRETDPVRKAKYRKQLELLEDAVVIYRGGRLPDPYRLPTARQYHTLPSFPFEHARARDFLKKVVDL